MEFQTRADSQNPKHSLIRNCVLIFHFFEFVLYDHLDFFGFLAFLKFTCIVVNTTFGTMFLCPPLRCYHYTHTPGQCYHIAHVLRPVTQHNFHTHATSHVCIIGFFRFHITCTRIGSIHHDTWVHVHVFTQSPSHNDTIDILCAFTTHLLRFHN